MNPNPTLYVPPFPAGPLVVTRENLWSALDIILKYVENQGRDELNETIGRLARFRTALAEPGGAAPQVPVAAKPKVSGAGLLSLTDEMFTQLKADLAAQAESPEEQAPGKQNPSGESAQPIPPRDEEADVRRVVCLIQRYHSVPVWRIAKLFPCDKEKVWALLRLRPTWFVVPTDHRVSVGLTEAGRAALRSPLANAVTPTGVSAAPTEPIATDNSQPS